MLCQLRDRVNCCEWQFKTKTSVKWLYSVCHLMYGSCLAHTLYREPTHLAIKCDIKLRTAWMRASDSKCCANERRESRKNGHLCYQLNEHKFFIDCSFCAAYFFFFRLLTQSLLKSKRKKIIYRVFIIQSFRAHCCEMVNKS